MSAAMRKYKSLYSSTTNSFGTGTGETITPASVVDLPTGEITLTFDRVDSSGTATPTKMERITGSISGGNFIITTRGVDGTTEQAHTSPVVEMVWNAADWNAAVDSILAEHNASGVHTSISASSVNGNTVPTGTDTFALLTASQTLTNKTMTSPTITGIASVLADGLNVNSMSRQAIINGNFDVWQRGTSIALTADNGYTADRWYVETATAGTDKTVSREDGTGVNGSYYCARVKMVSDVDELLTFSQALESQDSIKFRGKKLTLSFYARGGAEFVADNATLVSKIVTGKGTDQKVLAFTTSADGISQNNTLTTDWQKFTCTTTAAIAADITQVGVSFAFTHAGSGVTTNYFEVAQVQLCAGDVALPFQPKSFEEELRACQRYCWVPALSPANTVIGFGTSTSTTAARIIVSLPVTMRIIPTPTVTAGDYMLNDGGALTDVTALTNVASGQFNGNNYWFQVTVASGLTQYRPVFLISDGTTNRVMILSAEL